jgi:hypothetical protein
MKWLTYRAIRPKIASVFALWLAGFGCLLCCSGSLLEVSASSFIVSEENQTPKITASSSCCKKSEKISQKQNDNCKSIKTASSKDCKKAKKQEQPCKVSNSKINRYDSKFDSKFDSKIVLSAAQETPDSPCNVSCCLTNWNPLEPARPFQLDKSQLASISPDTILPDLSSEKADLQRAFPLHLSNQGYTYLRCCVFLI